MEEITLRDVFATAALIGMLSKQGSAGSQIADEAESSPNKAAIWSYEYADAMLAARALGVDHAE